MKVSKIICDRCKKEIEEYPIRVTLEFVDRDNGEFIAKEFVGADKLHDKDYCEECASKILAFMKGMSINPAFEKEVKKMEEEDKPKKVEIKVPDVEQKKPSVMDLILQGWSKEAVVKMTGCKPQTYDQTKYLLKKKGKLQEENEVEPAAKEEPKEEIKTYQCSKVGKTCEYAGKCSGTFICDYLDRTGHSRGCTAEACTRYVRRKK